jgi:hypothetical protein
MSDDNVAAMSIGLKSTGIRCHQDEIKGLTSDQLWALHLCKHEMAAAVHRLYPKVAPAKADPLLAKHFLRLINADA